MTTETKVTKEETIRFWATSAIDQYVENMKRFATVTTDPTFLFDLFQTDANMYRACAAHAGKLLLNAEKEGMNLIDAATQMVKNYSKDLVTGRFTPNSTSVSANALSMLKNAATVEIIQDLESILKS